MIKPYYSKNMVKRANQPIKNGGQGLPGSIYKPPESRDPPKRELRKSISFFGTGVPPEFLLPESFAQLCHFKLRAISNYEGRKSFESAKFWCVQDQSFQVIHSLKLTFSPLQNGGFQVRNLQTSRGAPFSGAFAVGFRG